MPENAALVNYYTQKSLDSVVRYPDMYRFPSIIYQDMISKDGGVIIDPYGQETSSPYTQTVILANFLRYCREANITHRLLESYEELRPVKDLPLSPDDGIYPQNGANRWPRVETCRNEIKQSKPVNSRAICVKEEVKKPVVHS
jgi:hypothetical protein